MATHPPLNVLKEELNKAGESSSVVYLGDNVYPKGYLKKTNLIAHVVN